MRKRLKVVLPVVLLAGAAALWWAGRASRSEDGGVFGSGVVEATEADLGFQLPGRVASVSVREGDHVQADRELATLDRTELVARRDAARAQLSAARARLLEMERGSRPEEIAQAEAVVRTAREKAEDTARDADRARRLHEGGAISQEALDKALTAREVANAELDRALEALELVRQGPRAEVVEAQRALVLQAEATVAQVEALLEQATVVAPFDGIVTIRHREPGEAVSAGAPVLTLRDLEDRWVRIYVREDLIGRVHIAQAASITADTYPDREYRGTVSFIASEAEFTPRNVQTAEQRTRLVYAVKVRIEGDPGHDLKPGIPADVRLEEPGRP